MMVLDATRLKQACRAITCHNKPVTEDDFDQTYPCGRLDFSGKQLVPCSSEDGLVFGVGHLARDDALYLRHVGREILLQ